MPAVLDADVLIVGAGPAGVAAGLDLVRGGLSVLMLDRPDGSASKPCAGGVTIKALQRFRIDITPVVRETVCAIDMSHAGRWPDRFSAASTVCLMTHRPELDQWHREAAVAAGVQAATLHGLARVAQHGDGVSVTGKDGQVFRGRWLIAADGAHSPVRRMLLGQPRGVAAVAIEGLLDRAQCGAEWPGMQLDFADQPGGYGWLFPKGDHVNVGLYSRNGQRHGVSRERLLDYARRRLGSDALTGIQGYPIPVNGDQRRITAGRVLFAGDAAGMAEALLGEGIYGALLSGQMAAAALLGAPQGVPEVAARYQALMSSWRRELRVTRHLARAFYRTLPGGYALLRLGLHRPLMQGFAAGLTLVQSKRAWLSPGAADDRPPGYRQTSGGRPD
ncbi:geranylgeranyl reductase family protein [Isoalcanivorax indicus]|uniref:geranylgeranyl reductase family protein n=1 Tax=Isoalcanivorax indicus TaxID=2202653 RepID=UPI001FE67CDA|nr:geranylgeranyl reductase family protein [Isoalcanivorax indicus]